MSHTAAEKNRHAAWNEIRPAIPAPASIPTTDRRPDRATIPVANTVNRTNVARRRNTGRKASSSPAHDPGKIIHRKVATPPRTGPDRHAADQHRATRGPS